MDANGTKQTSLDLFPDEISCPCPLRTQPHGCPAQCIQAGGLQAQPSPLDVILAKKNAEESLEELFFPGERGSCGWDLLSSLLPF